MPLIDKKPRQQKKHNAQMEVNWTHNCRTIPDDDIPEVFDDATLAEMGLDDGTLVELERPSCIKPPGSGSLTAEQLTKIEANKAAAVAKQEARLMEKALTCDGAKSKIDVFSADYDPGPCEDMDPPPAFVPESEVLQSEVCAEKILVHTGTAKITQCKYITKQCEFQQNAIIEMKQFVKPPTASATIKKNKWSLMTATLRDETNIDELFESVWKAVGNQNRNLAIALNRRSFVALLHKNDQCELVFSNCLPPHQDLCVHPFLNKGGTTAQKQNICKLFSNLCHNGLVVGANMSLENVELPKMADLYQTFGEYSPCQLSEAIGDAKIKKGAKVALTTTEKALISSQTEMKQYIKDIHDVKASNQKMCSDPRIRDIYTDFVNVYNIEGITWDAREQKYVQMKVIEGWLHTRQHLQKALALTSSSGEGKTPFAYSIAKDCALRYQFGDGPSYKPYFVTASTVEGLRQAIAAGMLVPGTPIVLEDFVPASPGGSERQAYEEFLVNLFEVLNVSTVAARNKAINLPAKSVVIMTTNRSRTDWLHCTDKKMEQAVWKRLLFVELPGGEIITSNAKDTGDADLDQIVAEGQQKKRQRLALL